MEVSEFNPTLEELRQDLAICERTETKDNLLPILSCLVEVLRRRGEFDEAEVILDRARSLVEDEVETDPGAAIQVGKQQRRLYLGARKLEAAKSAAMANLQIAASLDPQIEAGCLIDFGEVLFLLHEYEDASETAARAMSILENADATELDELRRIFALLGEINLALEKLETASGYFRRQLSIEIFNGDELTSPVARTLYRLGEIHLSLENYDEAEGSFTRACSIFKDQGGGLDYARALFHLSAVNAAQNRPEVAADLLCQCAVIEINEGADPDSISGTFEAMVRCLRHLERFDEIDRWIQKLLAAATEWVGVGHLGAGAAGLDKFGKHQTELGNWELAEITLARARLQ